MSIEGKQEGGLIFRFPDVKSEKGEIERVAMEFAGADPAVFTREFFKRAEQSRLVGLDEETWSKLENTDSFDITQGDWESVEDHAVNGNPDHPRDWEALKMMVERDEELEAPIICEKDGRAHLVSGNTRLMVSRGLGITPQVLWVKMD